MAKFGPDNAHFKKHLPNLRHVYTRLTPFQRMAIANQRMDRLDSPANELIAVVSAVEGLARSLVVGERVDRGEQFEIAYEAVRNRDPVQLVKEIAALAHVTPAKLVASADGWRLFRWACAYRNLLIHEATMLNENDAFWLIQSTRQVFRMISP